MEKSPNESRFNGFATDDCEEVLAFPAKSGGDRGVPEMDLEPNVIKQLRLLVSLIAMSYNDNKFHDFSHAAHVTVSLSQREHTLDCVLFLDAQWESV